MEEAAIVDGRPAWARLALVLLAGAIGNVGMWAYVVMLPAVQADFGAVRGAASLPYTVTMLGFALGNLVIGRIADRIGLARALALSALVQGAGFLAAALAPSLGAMAAAQAAIGFGSAACFGPLIADISFWFRRRRGIAVAVAASGNYLAGAIWPLLLSNLLQAQGWRALCLVLAPAIVAGLLPLAWMLRAGRPLQSAADTAAEAVRTAGTGMHPRTLLIVLALSGLGCCVAMSMPQVHIVPYCVDLGYGPAVGAEMLALMLAGGVVSRLASGVVADRLGGVKTLLIGASLQALALVLYLPAGSMVSLYAVSLIFGLSQGGIVPSYALIVRDYLPAREAGARVGLVIMATILGMALGGWMSGALYDATGSYRAAFLNGLAWNLIPIAAMVWLLRAGGGHAGFSSENPAAQRP
ncbi:MAG: MFS transporter [Gemmobacter sp.]